MNIANAIRRVSRSPERLSYVLIAGVLVVTAALHLGNLLLAALFSYLALSLFRIGGRVNRWLAVVIFVVLVSAGTYALTSFGKHAVRTLPEVASKAVPSVLQWAEERNVELPFTDYESLRELVGRTARTQALKVGAYARQVREVSWQALLLIAGCVVAISLFLTPGFELSRAPNVKRNNLYSITCEHLGARFATFYHSFATVIGAQIAISAINTLLTGIFVLVVGLPHGYLIVGATFLCGLLPVVGNLISNTIIVGIGFTVSPKMALWALLFLVTIHKLEYFLNSKIIGQRIRNPLWLILIGLVVGERLMGIPGIVLAPVVLNYIKLEASRFEVAAEPPAAPASAISPAD